MEYYALRPSEGRKYPLELLLLSCLSTEAPTTLNDAVRRLLGRMPGLIDADLLCAGAQPPCLAGPAACDHWRMFQREGWARLVDGGLVLTYGGEQRLDHLYEQALERAADGLEQGEA